MADRIESEAEKEKEAEYERKSKPKNKTENKTENGSEDKMKNPAFHQNSFSLHSIPHIYHSWY